MLTGQNGILNRAAEAKEKTESATEDEQRKLAQSEALMNIEKTTYKGITLPEGFAPTKIRGEDSIDEGLVITDGYGNEYVWVEVPRTDTVYPKATVNITEFDENAYTKIENDLHTYTEAYRNNTNYNDTYAKDTVAGWFKDADEYNEAKQKMLKSVYQNEGFWVGRYEAGSIYNRNSGDDNLTVPLSQKNIYPYKYVTRTQAKKMAEQVESGKYISSLMYGIQWDLILAFMHNKGNVDNMLLNEDSTSIGNYKNNEINILNKNAKYSIDSGKSFFKCPYKKDIANRTLLTTGADKSFSKLNIYDIAGNVWEWTLENSNDNNSPCVVRGGCSDNEGKDIRANYRAYANIPDNYYYIGFRVVLY